MTARPTRCDRGHALVVEDTGFAVASGGERRRYVCSAGCSYYSPAPIALPPPRPTTGHLKGVCVMCGRAYATRRVTQRACSKACGRRLAGQSRRRVEVEADV